MAFTEPEDAGEHEVDPDLSELHEVLEWEAALDAEAGLPPDEDA